MRPELAGFLVVLDGKAETYSRSALGRIRQFPEPAAYESVLGQLGIGLMMSEPRPANRNATAHRFALLVDRLRTEVDDGLLIRRCPLQQLRAVQRHARGGGGVLDGVRLVAWGEFKALD